MKDFDGIDIVMIILVLSFFASSIGFSVKIARSCECQECRKVEP